MARHPWTRRQVLDRQPSPSSRATARIAVAVDVVSVAALFGTSAAYHRPARSSTAQRRLRRLDHSMISVLIAST